jgi:hypothetical protein
MDTFNESHKIQCLKNIEKTLLLNNNDGELNQLINNVQNILNKFNNSNMNPNMKSNNSSIKNYNINNIQENIAKYKNYIDFLNFRKNKILKSINEY